MRSMARARERGPVFNGCSPGVHDLAMSPPSCAHPAGAASAGRVATYWSHAVHNWSTVYGLTYRRGIDQRPDVIAGSFHSSGPWTFKMETAAIVLGVSRRHAFRRCERRRARGRRLRRASSYENDWDGPTLIGVLAVHCLPVVVAAH